VLTSILAHGGSGLVGDGIPGGVLYAGVVAGALIGVAGLRARGPVTVGGDVVAALSVDGSEADPWPGDDAATGVRGAGQVLGLAALVLVLAVAWAGSDIVGLNPLPLLVGSFVWWVVPAASLLLGDWWRWLDPFDALAAGVDRIRGVDTRSAGDDESGDWWLPAALLASFAWVLTCWSEGLEPRSLALWVTALTALLVVGAATAGRAWVRRTSPLAVLCGTIAAASPLDWTGGRIRLRAPWRGLAARAGGRRTQAVLVVVLGATVWEAVAGSRWWADLASDGGSTARTLWSTLGLVWCTLLVATAWTATWLVAERVARSEGAELREPLAGDLAPTLAPLVAVAPLAHQLSPLLVDLQNLWALSSDPFAQGWDLLGSTDHDTVEEPISLGVQAWLQIGLLAAGLALGLVGAWDRLVARTGSVALTVGWAAGAWTVLSGGVALWLLLGA
jgi:hypothetical protein